MKLATIREAATVGTWRNRYKLEQETGEAVTVNGSVLRRALQAHISLALNNPGIDYPASERVIAEAARISRPAVKRATEMLIGYGVLRRRRPPGKLGRGTAAWYRLDASGKWLETLLANANTIDAAALSRFECHSVFRHGNGVRFDVWAYIVATPGADVKEIAAATGAHTRTVRRVIRRLAALELVERGSDGTAASRIADDEISAALDIAAFESGMAQRSAKQAERYEQERQQHAETIEKER